MTKNYAVKNNFYLEILSRVHIPYIESTLNINNHIKRRVLRNFDIF